MKVGGCRQIRSDWRYPGEETLAAADIDREPSRYHQEGRELVAVVAPEAVMPWGTRPVDPFLGLGFPSFAEVHVTIQTSKGGEPLSG